MKSENLNECGVEDCDKKFGTDTSLSVHRKRYHPDTKTFKKCQKCDHLTRDNGSLRHHEKICLENENMNRCKAEGCDKQFGTEISLANHVKRNHPKIIQNFLNPIHKGFNHGIYNESADPAQWR